MSAQASAPQLRPLGIGEILDVGIKIYSRNWLTLCKIVVFVVLPAQILVNVVQISALPNGVDAVERQRQPLRAVHHAGDGHPPRRRDLPRRATSSALLISFVAARFAQAGCFRAIADAYLGEEVGWRSSLRFALRRLAGARRACSFSPGSSSGSALSSASFRDLPRTSPSRSPSRFCSWRGRTVPLARTFARARTGALVGRPAASRSSATSSSRSSRSP